MNEVIPSHSPTELSKLWDRVGELVTGALFVPELREMAMRLRPVVDQALTLCGMQNVPALARQMVRDFLLFIRTAGVREDTVQWLEMYGPGY